MGRHTQKGYVWVMIPPIADPKQDTDTHFSLVWRCPAIRRSEGEEDASRLRRTPTSKLEIDNKSVTLSDGDGAELSLQIMYLAGDGCEAKSSSSANSVTITRPMTHEEAMRVGTHLFHVDASACFALVSERMCKQILRRKRTSEPPRRPRKEADNSNKLNVLLHGTR